MQNQEPLLTTYQMGDILLRNRVVMSSLTRCRATNPDLAPTDLHVEYYAQRASAGLILTEGVYISERAIGYINIPGIYSKKQTEAWKRVTDAVHTKNGRIFVQLAHSGSVSHPDFFNGQLPLGPSAINPQEKSFTLLGFKDTLTPAEYTTAQIKETIKEYRLAAENAKTAGFDGLEIHAQNSSLIPQFLSEATNQRTDEYGGSIENRSRLLFEILDAVKEVYPAKHIGVKFTPAGFNRGIIKPDITTVAVFNYILEKLNGYHLAFVELVGPAVDLTGTPLDILKDNYFEHFRNIYKGTIMANIGFTQESGNAIIGKETADLVSFGTAYIANPDLVQRFGQNIPLSKGDPDTYYGGGGAKGFTDYPFATSEAMGRLKGKVALVTGGSRGIGAGIVGKLAQEGASVAFTYVNATEKANKLQNELTVLGGDILSIKADSSQTQEVEHAIQLAVKKFGRIDILVNNAGLYFGGKIDSPDMDMVSIARMWQVNVAGIAHTVRSITPYMLPGSRIISIGSGAAARTPFAGVGDYAATKAALAAYTRSWARDLAEKSITVNLIQPGLIETDLKPNDESLIAEMLQPVALKRFGTPVEIGNVVAFLASDEASYVTGATINVDGGWSA